MSTPDTFGNLKHPLVNLMDEATIGIVGEGIFEYKSRCITNGLI
jgi:hypothetical protein